MEYAIPVYVIDAWYGRGFDVYHFLAEIFCELRGCSLTPNRPNFVIVVQFFSSYTLGHGIVHRLAFLVSSELGFGWGTELLTSSSEDAQKRRAPSTVACLHP